MHFILFQNAFEIAFFFWIWLQYAFDSCIMGHVRFIIPRLVIGAFVQVLCSYSTLPLYAIVTQVSPLYRSKRAVEIIWSARKEEIIIDFDLREIDLYFFQVSLISQHLFHQMCNYIICFNDFSSRSVLVVAHNAVNQALVATAIGLGTEYFKILLQSNCGVSVLDFTPRLEGGRPQIHLL
ncbi:hypothetical protein ACSBR2_008862 [Camellia fascicularis]